MSGSSSRRAGLTRRGAFTATAGAVGVLAAACGPLSDAGRGPSGATAPPKGPVAIEFWSPWTGLQYEGPTGMIARIGDAFSARNAQITVMASTARGAEIVTKLVATAAAGTPPDVLIMFNSEGQLYRLAHQGIIGALEDVARGELGRIKEWAHPSMWDLGMYRDKLYGLPVWSQGYALMWHKAHFREVGLDPEKLPARSLEEVPELGRRLSKTEGDGLAYTRVGFWDGWFGCCPHLLLMTYIPAFGGQLTDPQGVKATADHPNNVRALEWIVNTVRRVDLNRVLEFQKTFGTIRAGPYLAGHFSLWRDGPWRLATMKANGLRFEDYGVAPIPDPTGMSGGFANHYGDLPVIPKDAKQRAAAWRFVRFLTGFDGEETYAQLHLVQPQIPISEKLAKGPAFKHVLDAWPNYEVWLRQFFSAKRVMAPPKTPAADVYIAALRKFGDQAFKGELTPRDALHQANAEAQRELDAFRRS